MTSESVEPSIDANRSGSMQHQVAPHFRIVPHEAVVHEEPAAVAKRMAVGFLRRGIRRRADMRDEQRRAHGPRGVAQIAVAPRGVRAAVAERDVSWMAVPADAEAVAVGGGLPEPRMQALVDQRMLGPEQHGFELNRVSCVSQPAAHDRSPR